MELFGFFTGQEMQFELLRIIIALVGTTIAAYYDIFNKKNIPTNILYGFLAISFLVNLLDLQNFFSATIFGVLVFIIFYFLYRAGQIGGADGYILSSITMVLPYQPKMFLIVSGFFILPFIFNVFVFASISFILYVFLYTLTAVIKNINKIERKNALSAFLVLLSYLVFLYVISSRIEILALVGPAYIIAISLMVIFIAYYTLFKNVIHDAMIEFVDVKNVEPEDMIAVEKMDQELVKKYDLKRLVTKEQYQKMKAIKGKKIALYKNLPPFVPHILLGLIFGILFGDLLTLLSNIL
ncbi:MAG: hypothetical protein N3D10_00280 [Candidatus Micrarchaeota archaeon]|nr:hypothetical protein [Candidatus Micrarchaeota archaeon]